MEKRKKKQKDDSNNSDFDGESSSSKDSKEQIKAMHHGGKPGPRCSKRMLESDEDEDDGSAKRRLSQLRENDTMEIIEDGQASSSTSDTRGKAGVVQKIRLKNFMCHSSMEITLNPRINFIVGRNGSGKSAILTALVVGLGSSATTTNRGSSLKQFIKHGSTNASIEIILNNCGTNSYKPEIFGDKLIVMRKFTDSSSTYSVKGSMGNVVFTKREDLLRIVDHFSIQVDNPISVLNQDTARSFLNNSNPREKYELFMRATQLQLLWDLAFATLESKNKALVLLNEKKNAVSLTKKDIDALELRWNQVRAIQGYRKKITNLRDELNWAVAIMEEKNLATLQKKKEELEAHVSSLRQAVENQSSNENGIKEEMHGIESRINDIREEAKAQEGTYTEVKAKAGRCKEAYAKKLQSYKLLGVKVQRHETNVCSLHAEINKLQGNEDNSAQKLQDIREQISYNENKYEEVNATLKTVDHHLSQLRGQDGKYIEDIQQNRAELSECNRRINKLKEQIASMQSNSSNKLAVYGSYMPVLVQKIKEATRQGKFNQPPIGPLGAYIQVTESSWAPAIENFLGNFLRTFCVVNSADHMALNKIMQSVLGTKRKPTVIIGDYADAVHNVEQYAVRSSMLDALIISNPVIANCLIDQREIETIMLIATSKEACAIMKDERLVPRNCKRSITMHGDQFYPDPDFRSYGGNVNATAQYLQVNMADVIRGKEAELKTITMHKGKLEKEVEHIGTLLKNNNIEIVELKKEKTKLQQALIHLREKISALKDSEEPETTSIATLHAELEESSVQLQALKNEEKNLAGECEVLKSELETAKKEAIALRDAAHFLQKKEQPLLDKLEGLRDDLRELVAEKGYRARKVREAEEKLNTLNSRVTQQTQVTDKAISFAAQIHPGRIDTDKSSSDLDAEIKALEKVVASVEKETGDYTAVGTELSEKKERYDKTVKELQHVTRALQILDQLTKDRKKIYTKIQRFVCVSVNEMFSIQLCAVGFTGDVKIDHVRQELVIAVQPSHRSSSDDIKTLSGGERSYSTVGFIMSLWDTANPPFYFMDEFDVFMDKVNRRITLDMLVAAAHLKKNNQFVFLTPQDSSNIAVGSDVTIHRMGNPREEV